MKAERAAEPRKSKRDGRGRRIWPGVAVLVLLIGITAAWQWTPLAEQIDIRRVARWAAALRDHPGLPAIVLGSYVIGSILSFPITILIMATAIVFGPIEGIAYSLAGCLLGAAVTYALGYLLGKDWARRVLGSKWCLVERAVSQTGLIAVTTLRLLPVAPFTIVNVASGALQVPFWKYLAGSVLGLAPGIVVINVFARQLERAIRNPGPGSIALLALLVAITVAGVLWLRRGFRKESRK